MTGGVVVDERGDEELAAVLDREWAALQRLAFLLVGERQAAEDAVAAAAERVLVAWRRGIVTEPLPYLRRAVVNEVRSAGRQAGSRRRRERLYARRSPWTLDGPADTSSRRAEVLAALDTLGPRQRAVLVLRYFADLTEHETAAVLGVSVGTVKSQAARAIAHLRPRLLGEEH
jgi:RNA polymerase sigma factor (sigma-70 family)